MCQLNQGGLIGKNLEFIIVYEKANMLPAVYLNIHAHIVLISKVPRQHNFV